MPKLITLSPSYSGAKDQEPHTPQTLTDYLISETSLGLYVTRRAQGNRSFGQDFGGFWFDMPNSQIRGLEGEFRLWYDPAYTEALALLISLTGGYHEVTPASLATKWRKINEFEHPREAVKTMFDVAEAFKDQDYSLELELGAYEENSPVFYRIKSLFLRKRELVLSHPSSRAIPIRKSA